MSQQPQYQEGVVLSCPVSPNCAATVTLTGEVTTEAIDRLVDYLEITRRIYAETEQVVLITQEDLDAQRVQTDASDGNESIE